MLVTSFTKHKMPSQQEYGYTLIQMAIALIVLGLLSAAFVQIYNLYAETQKVITTQQNLNIVTQQLQTYRQAFGRYPCPAPMNVTRESLNPLYGQQSDYAAFLPAGLTPLLPGQCGSGMCIEQTTRTISGVPTDLRVRVGAIPFRDMQLDEDKSFDGYGSRFWYAVTEDMCNTATFDDTRGGIRIENELGESQTNPQDSAGFVVISSGKNKIGGYSKFGTLQMPCGGTDDAQNCRDVSVSPQAGFASTYLLTATADGTDNFDDSVEYFSASVNQLWRRTTPTSENIVDLANDSVGIGVANPTAALEISQSTINAAGNNIGLNSVNAGDQNGALRVKPLTNLHATRYCDETGGNCFEANDIAGKDSEGTGGMKCPAGQYAVAIRSTGTEAEFECTNKIAAKCPITSPPSVFIGFITDAAGNLVPSCSNASAFASCAATTINGCAPNDINLPPLTHGQTTAVFSKGSCRKLKYRCNNGAWENAPGFPTGSCVAAVTTTNGIACGNCWSGTYSQTINSCAATTNTRATDCSCQACTTNVRRACPASEPSGIPPTITYNYICNPASPHAPAFIDPLFPDGKVTVAGTCSCNALSRNQFSSCPLGMVRDPAAPAPKVSETVSTNSWPADRTKGIYQSQTVDAATCTNINSADPPVNQCICDTADKYTGAAVSPPQCKKIKSGSRSFGGISFDWNKDVYVQSILDRATCTFKPPVLHDAAQFEDNQMYWRQQPGNPFDFGVTPPAGTPTPNDTCSCAQHIVGADRTCKIGSSSGIGYDLYKCKCQP